MITDELLSYIFNAQPHLLAPAIEAWLVDSRRFTEFVRTFRDKIRKKIRTTQDEETLLDLRLELETAYLLLREERLSLVYEPGQAETGRRPDFAVRFTTSLTFLLEVTRVRNSQRSLPPDGSDETTAAQMGDRLADTVCSKLGQFIHQQSNVLLIGIDETDATTGDSLRDGLLRAQQRAEGNDGMFLRRYQCRDRADFFRQYQRLSEVIVRGAALPAGEPPVVWVNPQARQPLPARVRTALHRSHTG